MGRGRKVIKPKRKPKSTMDAATAYVNTVKKAFRGEGQISTYLTFLQLLNQLDHDVDTNSETMPYEDLLRKLNDLFRLHPHLIAGFNVFLPREYHYDAVVATLAGGTSETPQRLR